MRWKRSIILGKKVLILVLNQLAILMMNMFDLIETMMIIMTIITFMVLRATFSMTNIRFHSIV